MSSDGAAAGWYEDPYQPSQLRYFDGGAWTAHTSPAVSASSLAGTAVVAAPRHRIAPPAALARSWYSTTPRRVVVITAITFASLYALSFGMQILAGARAANSGSAQATALPGPSVLLSPSAPATLVGRDPNTGTELAGFKAQWAAAAAKDLGSYPAASTTHVEVYGPGPKAAPTRGSGVIAIAWASTQAEFPMDQAMRGVTQGLTSQHLRVLGPVLEPSGAQIACGSSATFTICQWIRSGTGFVEILEYETDAALVATDTRELAAELTTP